MTHSDPTPNPAPHSQAKPPFASLTLKGAVAMALAYASSRFGLNLPDAVAASAASALIDLVFTLGLIAVGVGRARASAPLR